MADMFNVSVRNSAKLNAQLEDFARDIKERRKYAKRLGGYVRTQARRNVRSQEHIEGAPFDPRKNRKDARPMLLKLAAAMEVIATGEEGGVVVSWKNALTASIAYRQQHGDKEAWTGARARQVYGSPDYKAPCTRPQAKALLKCGYRLMVPARGGGRRPKRVTVMWLQQHFSLGQAGLILRALDYENTGGDSKGNNAKWDILVPARSFLGVTAAEAEKMTTQLAQSILRATRR